MTSAPGRISLRRLPARCALRVRRAWALPAVCLAAVLSAWPLSGIAQSRFNSSFDHFTTGFALEGPHAIAACESCHVDGVFQGTPTDCASCHSQGGRIRATPKPADHVLSSDMCNDCHRDRAWFPLAEMNHDAVYGSCASCHNNVQSAGKPPDHPITQLDCALCHRTTAWVPARFDHTGVIGDCAACHNGVEATGKNASHITTSDFCEDCHTTVTFAPAKVDHLQVLGTCSSCHNGATAIGKDAGHFQTQLECDTCHSTTAWQPLTFAHSSASYPGDHAAPLICTDCHTTNAEAVPWPFPTYAPDCAACHAADFRSGEHDGATVSDLRDCAGTCHQTRPQHSVRSRDW
jgi:hypothetical protein